MKNTELEWKEKEGWMYYRRVGGVHWIKAYELCHECFQHPVDHKNGLCSACEAYREHQS